MWLPEINWYKLIMKINTELVNTLLLIEKTLKELRMVFDEESDLEVSNGRSGDNT